MRNIYIILFLFVITACVVSQTYTINRLIEESRMLDQKSLRVSGFLRPDSLGHLYLYPNQEAADAENYQHILDVILLDQGHINVNRLFSKSNVICVSIEGVFKEYSNKRLPLGYLRSNIGLIEVSAINVSSNCVQ